MIARVCPNEQEMVMQKVQKPNKLVKFSDFLAPKSFLIFRACTKSRQMFLSTEPVFTFLSIYTSKIRK
jgi:hypothetical protein